MATRDRSGNATANHSGSRPINTSTVSGPSFNNNISGGTGNQQYIANHQYFQTTGGADQDRLDQQFREALYLTSPELERRTLIHVKGEVSKNTCDWILAEEAFLAWLNEEEQRLLWVHGGARLWQNHVIDLHIAEFRD